MIATDTVVTGKHLAVMDHDSVYSCSDGLCRQSLADKQEKLRGYETQINNATKGVDLDSSLESVQSKLQTHQKYVLPA